MLGLQQCLASRQARMTPIVNILYSVHCSEVLHEIVQKVRDSTRKSEKHELIREVSRTMFFQHLPGPETRLFFIFGTVYVP